MMLPGDIGTYATWDIVFIVLSVIPSDRIADPTTIRYTLHYDQFRRSVVSDKGIGECYAGVGRPGR